MTESPRLTPSAPSKEPPPLPRRVRADSGVFARRDVTPASVESKAHEGDAGSDKGAAWSDTDEASWLIQLAKARVLAAEDAEWREAMRAAKAAAPAMVTSARRPAPPAKPVVPARPASVLASVETDASVPDRDDLADWAGLRAKSHASAPAAVPPPLPKEARGSAREKRVSPAVPALARLALADDPFAPLVPFVAPEHKIVSWPMPALKAG